EAVCNRHGFISVFNIGPTGNLTVLYPDEPRSSGTFTAPMALANQSVLIHDIEMMVPAGRERLFAVWSRHPLPIRLDRLLSRDEGKGKKAPPSRGYAATRDMKRVQQSVERLDPGDWKAVSVELEHEPPDPGPRDESPRDSASDSA